MDCVGEWSAKKPRGTGLSVWSSREHVTANSELKECSTGDSVTRARGRGLLEESGIMVELEEV